MASIITPKKSRTNESRFVSTVDSTYVANLQKYIDYSYKAAEKIKTTIIARDTLSAKEKNAVEDFYRFRDAFASLSVLGCFDNAEQYNSLEERIERLETNVEIIGNGLSGVAEIVDRHISCISDLSVKLDDFLSSDLPRINEGIDYLNLRINRLNDYYFSLNNSVSAINAQVKINTANIDFLLSAILSGDNDSDKLEKLIENLKKLSKDITSSVPEDAPINVLESVGVSNAIISGLKSLKVDEEGNLRDENGNIVDDVEASRKFTKKLNASKSKKKNADTVEVKNIESI